jgi:hypothetical protein
LFNEDDIKEINILDIYGNTEEDNQFQHYHPDIEVEESAILIYEHPDLSEIPVNR